MGASKKKRARFLVEHPKCCYCGEVANTIDHCPPRCIFPGRNWPESFEFPACAGCNSESRLDEQLIAVLARISLNPGNDPAKHAEWASLVQGVNNNQPEVLREWNNIQPTSIKRSFRNMFGKEGDFLRHSGYSMISLGPISRGAIHRFAIKLSQALYYKHCQEVLIGKVLCTQFDPEGLKKRSGALQTLLNLAPLSDDIKRNGASLLDNFAYRYNYNLELGVLYVIARFSDQMYFNIIAMRESFAEKANFDALGEFRPIIVPAKLNRDCGTAACARDTA